MIYILEDDDNIRKLVLYALRTNGFEAEGFDRPGPFWTAMEGRQPRLLLLDIMLPEEDGLSVLRRLRQAPETANLPVILLTAKAQGENMMYCERLPITVPRNACKRWIDPKRRIKRIWEDWKQNYIFEVTEYERTENQ